MNKKKNVLAIVAVIMLVALLSICLVACNADTYKNKLEDKGYTVVAFSPEKMYADKVEWGVTGSKLKSADMVSVIKFKKIEFAKNYENEANKQSVMKVERQSSIVFVGTEQGIKDAK